MLHLTFRTKLVKQQHSDEVWTLELGFYCTANRLVVEFYFLHIEILSTSTKLNLI